MSYNQFKRYNNHQSSAFSSNRYTKPLWRNQQRQKSKSYANKHDYSSSQSRQHYSRSPVPYRNRNQEKQHNKFGYEQQKKYQRKIDTQKKHYQNYGSKPKYLSSKRFNQRIDSSKNQKYSKLTQDPQSEDDLSTQPSIEENFKQANELKQQSLQKKPSSQKVQQPIPQINPELLGQKLLQLIQLLNYDNLTDLVEKEFLQICKDHVYFVAGKPQSKSKVGQVLLQNGIFHEMWSKILLKNTVFDKDIIVPVYYEKYKDKILKNTTNFQISFNPIPQCPTQIQQFKRYRKLFDTSMNFTTKLNCMKLYQEVRRQLRDEQSQELNSILSKRRCSWEIATAQMQLGIKQKQLQGEDQSQTIKTLNKIGYQMDPDTKVITAKRQKSPQTGRFRLMEQTQTNQRRAAVQMACVFLNIDRIFHISDVDIVRVRECYKNDKVQLAVVQGYVAEFDQRYKKMKIQLKQRTLIAAYKFVGLEQLIRIEKTYGQIYGLMVYDEHLDIKKYLDNIEKCRIICLS